MSASIAMDNGDGQSSYYDFSLEDCSRLSLPSVCPVSRNRVLVSDASGWASTVDTELARIVSRAFLGEMAHGVPCNCSLQRGVRNPNGCGECAIATRGGYAAVWNGRGPDFVRVESGHGPVNAVAYSPDGQMLLLGTGGYPMSSHTWTARLELWDLRETPSVIGGLALPGVSVDSISWIDEPEIILCSTGLVNQKSGFLVCLDGKTLRPMSFFEIPAVMVRHLEALDIEVDFESGWPTNGSLIASHGGWITAYRLSELDSFGLKDAVIWQKRVDGGMADFAVDRRRDEVLLADGNVLERARGAVVRTLPALADCRAVVCVDRGRFVGVSSSGTFRVWGDEDRHL